MKQIASRNDFPQITIHTPMAKAGSEVEQNRIRLKNAVKESIEKLGLHSISEQEARQLLSPVASLSDDYNAMQHQQGGLSLFVHSDGYDEIQTPIDLDRHVDAGSYPNVLPLLRPAIHNRDYFILTLSLGGVGLYRATRYQLSFVNIPSLPEDLCYVLRYDEFEKSLQPHSTARGDESGGIHGHGMGKDEHEVFVNRFVDAVHRETESILNREQLPLVLVGNGEVTGRFRAKVDYPLTVKESVQADPHALTTEQLLTRSWGVISPTVEQERVEMLDTVRSSNHRSSGVHGVLSALTEGRAAACCIDPAMVISGTFDRSTGEVHQVPADSGGALENLNNVVAAEAIRMSVPIVLAGEQEMVLPAVVIHD